MTGNRAFAGKDFYRIKMQSLTRRILWLLLLLLLLFSSCLEFGFEALR